MQSQQDRIPTHQLGKEMALDSQGRVLRRPYFVTKSEHDAEVTNLRRQIVDLANRPPKIMETMVPVTISYRKYPEMRCRRRLQFLVRRLVKIDA